MVTTATTALAAAAGSSLILITIITVMLLLFQKEIASTLDGERAARWSRIVTVVLAPLLVVCALALFLMVVSVVG